MISATDLLHDEWIDRRTHWQSWQRDETEVGVLGLIHCGDYYRLEFDDLAAAVVALIDAVPDRVAEQLLQRCNLGPLDELEE